MSSQLSTTVVYFLQLSTTLDNFLQLSTTVYNFKQSLGSPGFPGPLSGTENRHVCNFPASSWNKTRLLRHGRKIPPINHILPYLILVGLLMQT